MSEYYLDIHVFIPPSFECAKLILIAILFIMGFETLNRETFTNDFSDPIIYFNP